MTGEKDATAEMSDEEIEQIWESAAEAGKEDPYLGRRQNPYANTSEQAELWQRAYLNAYARENGR